MPALVTVLSIFPASDEISVKACAVLANAALPVVLER